VSFQVWSTLAEAVRKLQTILGLLCSTYLHSKHKT
jgi:hypothetical protein